MSAHKSVAQRLGRVLETVTRQSGRLSETPAYGSLLLGRVTRKARHVGAIRIQIILTVLVVGVNLIGIGVAVLLVTVAIPEPSVFDDAPLWLTFGVVPAYVAVALALGTYWITRRTVTRAALGDRGAPTDPRRRAQHLPGPVASRDRRPHPVGGRGGADDDPLRPGQHDVHPAVPVRGELLRRPGRHRQLPARRVRAASGGRPGTRGRDRRRAGCRPASWAEP